MMKNKVKHGAINGASCVSGLDVKHWVNQGRWSLYGDDVSIENRREATYYRLMRK